MAILHHLGFVDVYGVKLIDFLNRVSVPALFIMLIWGVIAALMRGAAAAVTVYQPPMVLGWTYGITLAVAGFASGAVTCGDYTRYGRNLRHHSFLHRWRSARRYWCTGHWWFLSCRYGQL